MAKKKSETSNNTINRITSFIDIAKKERPRFLSGVLLVFIGFYTFLGQASFFFTGAIDQSKILNKSLWDLISEKQYITNWTGVVGAYIAERLINQWLGIFSLVIPVFLFIAGLKLMRLINISVLKVFLISAFIIVWGSVVSSLTLANLFPDTYIIWGGAHGQYVELLLERLLGIPGLVLLLVLLLISFLVAIKEALIPIFRTWVLKDRSQKTEENLDSDQETPSNKNWLSKLFNRKEEESDEEDEDDDIETERVGTDINTVPESIYYPDPVEDYQAITPKEESTKKDPITPKSANGFEVIMAEEEESIPAQDYENEIVQQNPDPIIINGEELEEYNPRLDLSHYAFPTNTLLKVYDTSNAVIDMEEQNENKNKITNTLLNYGIEITSIKATVGPTITLYEIVPKAGVRISKIRNLEDDIALSLSALGIRIIAPIPGKGTIGIEVPNKDPQIVSMQSVISSKKFQDFKGELPIAIGKTITNETFVFDLAKMPHLLVAGATGQGKSVGLNAIITSLLYKKHPAEMKMVLVDPKMVEFSIYATIEKHYLAKLPDEEKAIITDVSRVTQTLNSLTIEMDQRYELLMNAGVRNIVEYNELFKKRRLSPVKGHKFLPYMVIVIDEFGDLIMTAGKEIEMPIARIAQKARAVGMHLIIATQRPTTNIITGTIKANFPARMAFRVMSQIDSRTILDMSGANQLIGRGDMLFSQGSDLIRIQCAFVDTPEVQQITSYIGDQQGYACALELPECVQEGGEALGAIDLNDRDALFEEAARLIVVHQSGSTSLIQRKFSIGYNRAGRLMDQLEAAGIVGQAQGSKPREVLIMDEYSLEQKFSSLNS